MEVSLIEQGFCSNQALILLTLSSEYKGCPSLNHSKGRELALDLLQEPQQQARLFRVLCPPLCLGTMWSIVAVPEVNWRSQYAHFHSQASKIEFRKRFLATLGVKAMSSASRSSSWNMNFHASWPKNMVHTPSPCAMLVLLPRWWNWQTQRV